MSEPMTEREMELAQKAMDIVAKVFPALVIDLAGIGSATERGYYAYCLHMRLDVVLSLDFEVGLPPDEDEEGGG